MAASIWANSPGQVYVHRRLGVELACVLRSCDRPPGLYRASARSLPADDFRDGVEVRLTFDIGDRSVRFDRGDIAQHCDRWAFDDVDRFCRLRYSELVEDWHINRQIREMRLRLVEATRAGVGPDLLHDMQSNLRDFEEHARRHHRGERVNIPITRGVRAEPLAIHPLDFSGLRYETVSLPALPEPGPYTEALGRLLSEARDDLMREALGFAGGGGGAGGGGNSNAVAGSGGAVTAESLREAYEMVRGAGGGGGGGAGSYVGGVFADRLFVTMAGGGGGGAGYDVGTEEAQAKGMSLLKANLTPKQLQQYETHKQFEVIGCETGTTYRIRHGRQMNIDALNRMGTRTHGICFLPTGNLVAGDCMLAQKIALETMESEALRIANRFP